MGGRFYALVSQPSGVIFFLSLNNAALRITASKLSKVAARLPNSRTLEKEARSSAHTRILGFGSDFVVSSIAFLTASPFPTSRQARIRVSASWSAKICAATAPNDPFAPVMRIVLPLKEAVGMGGRAFACLRICLKGITSMPRSWNRKWIL